MNKLLISWSAFNNDYTWLYRGTSSERKDRVKENGPTFTVQKYFGHEYDKHILLNSTNKKAEVDFFNLLVTEAKKNFKNPIEARNLIIDDPIDINEIFLKVSDLLSEFRNFEIDIFVNPGTPQMQIAWYLVSPTFKKNVKLFQLREIQFTKEKKEPERIYSTIDTIFNPTVLSIANEVSSKSLLRDKILISDSIRPVYLKAEQIASTHNNIGCLILGEHGTGKENLAKFIHDNSKRKNGPFLAINCAAYNEEILSSELFGHEKGAFTGAINLKKGIFENAHGGTIFLDEIGDISPKMQASLLRVIQEKKIYRVGSSKEITVDVRVISATNKNLEELCEQKYFRWDLYFRLAITTLNLPPLREWNKVDIRKLIDHFNMIYFHEFPNRQVPLILSKDIYNYLVNYHFKGNIRELQNLMIAFYVFCNKEVTLDNLPERIMKNEKSPISMEENEKLHIMRIFKSKGGNINQTAKALKITRDTLKSKLSKYSLR